jgi:hypothetical protein
MTSPFVGDARSRAYRVCKSLKSRVSAGLPALLRLRALGNRGAQPEETRSLNSMRLYPLTVIAWAR